MPITHREVRESLADTPDTDDQTRPITAKTTRNPAVTTALTASASITGARRTLPRTTRTHRVMALGLLEAEEVAQIGRAGARTRTD